METFIDTYNKDPSTKSAMVRQRMHCILEPDEKMGGLYLGGLVAALNCENYDKYSIKCVLGCASEIPARYPKNFVGTHLIIPAFDFPSYDIQRHFAKAIEYIDTNRKTGASVFVHCQAGVSRSATFVIAYLVKAMKMNVDDALKYVKERRQIVRPNDGFLRQLKEYEMKVLGTKSQVISKR